MSQKEVRKVEAVSKSERVLVERIRATQEAGGNALRMRDGHNQKAREFDVQAVAAQGALNALVETAKELGIDLSKHFPPPSSTPVPVAAEDGGNSSSPAGQGDAPPALSVVPDQDAADDAESAG